MSAAVPPIYAGPSSPVVASWTTRLLAMGLAAACLAVLLTAASLRPDPAGIGTHERLGMGACDFARRTGVPCITCGMTTSFAHFAHGQFLASLYVQPMGFVLATLAAGTFWAGLYIGLTGRPAHRLLRFGRPTVIVITLFAMGIAAWGWKIYIHVNHWDGWH